MSYYRLHAITTSSFCCTSFRFRNYHLNLTPSIVNCTQKSFSMEGIGSRNMVISDPVSLQQKIAAIRADGPSKLQQQNPEYDMKRQKLYDHYHPIEICPTVPVEEKTKLMEEWWGKTHGLLVEGGLTFDDIRKSVANARVAFREGVVELFELLEGKNVPILIFSAGLADIIEEVLRQKVQRLFKNIEIVSNRMVFDNQGSLLAFKGKTIHVLNKNEHALDMAAPTHGQIGDVDGPVIDCVAMKKRTNVLLLGDHIGDLGMSDGLNYETRISVGFLNDKVDESLESFCKAFDVVLLNDAPMLEVSGLVSQLIKQG
ncbi:7-methylguanosine phosphate-specific 5'-nucleotidase [Bienertia sinuspersici]